MFVNTPTIEESVLQLQDYQPSKVADPEHCIPVQYNGFAGQPMAPYGYYHLENSSTEPDRRASEESQRSASASSSTLDQGIKQANTAAKYVTPELTPSGSASPQNKRKRVSTKSNTKINTNTTPTSSSISEQERKERNRDSQMKCRARKNELVKQREAEMDQMRAEIERLKGTQSKAGRCITKMLGAVREMSKSCGQLDQTLEAYEAYYDLRVEMEKTGADSV